jgi:hypothetical protein
MTSRVFQDKVVEKKKALTGKRTKVAHQLKPSHGSKTSTKKQEPQMPKDTGSKAGTAETITKRP